MEALLAHFHSLDMKTGCGGGPENPSGEGFPRENDRMARGGGRGELEEGREGGREGGRDVDAFSTCRCWLDLRDSESLGRASCALGFLSGETRAACCACSAQSGIPDMLEICYGSSQLSGIL